MRRYSKTSSKLSTHWVNPKNNLKCLGQTLKWAYPTENIEDFVRKVRQVANVLGKSQEDQVLKLKMSSQNMDI